MTYGVTERFEDLSAKLPRRIQKQAVQKLELWADQPQYPSLHFKKIRGSTWSIRISRAYGILGRRSDDHVLWTWIGTPSDYERETGRL